jgi:hypothetical protein
MRRFISYIIIVTIILSFILSNISCKSVVTASDIKLVQQEKKVNVESLEFKNYDLINTLGENKDKIYYKALPITNTADNTKFSARITDNLAWRQVASGSIPYITIRYSDGSIIQKNPASDGPIILTYPPILDAPEINSDKVQDKSIVLEYDFGTKKNKEIASFDIKEWSILDNNNNQTEPTYLYYLGKYFKSIEPNTYRYVNDLDYKPIALKSCGDNISIFTGSNEKEEFTLNVTVNGKMKKIDDNIQYLGYGSPFSTRIDNQTAGNFIVYGKEIDTQKLKGKFGIYDICNDKLTYLTLSSSIYSSLSSSSRDFWESKNYFFFYTYEDYFTNTLEIISKKDFTKTKKLFIGKSIIYGGHYDEDIVVLYDKYFGKFKVVNLNNLKDIFGFSDHNLLMDNCVVTKNNNLLSVYLFPYLFADGYTNKFVEYTYNIKNRSLLINNIFTPKNLVYLVRSLSFSNYFLKTENKFVCFAKDLKNKSTNLVIISPLDSTITNISTDNHKFDLYVGHIDFGFFSTYTSMGNIVNEKYILWNESPQEDYSSTKSKMFYIDLSSIK